MRHNAMATGGACTVTFTGKQHVLLLSFLLTLLARASEAYFLPGGACQLGNESSPTSTSVMSRFLRRAHYDGVAFAGLLRFGWFAGLFAQLPRVIAILIPVLVITFSALMLICADQHQPDQFHQHQKVCGTSTTCTVNCRSGGMCWLIILLIYFVMLLWVLEDWVLGS